MVNGGLQILETNSDGSVGEFSLLKPASTDPTGDLQKSGDLSFFRQVFGQISSDPTRFMSDLGRSQLDLVEISLDLARSHQI